MRMDTPPSNINNENKVNKDESKKGLRVPTWLKASVLSLSLIGSSPSFAQGNEGQLKDNDKNKTELMKDMSSFYNQVSLRKETSLKYLDKEGMSSDEVLKIEDEVKKDIAFCKEIANNPEAYYQKILEKSETIRQELITHFSSVEFLNKLREHQNEDDAKSKQERIIDNLNTVQIVVASPDGIVKQTKHHGVGGYYSINKHSVLIPFSNISEEHIRHELIHSAYRADGELNKDEKDILKKDFKKSKNLTNRENKYQHDVSERIVRKTILDDEMQNLGLKKYNEKFTHNHYKKLQELKDKNGLGEGATNLMETTTEDQMIDLMNNIAFQDAIDLNSNTLS